MLKELSQTPSVFKNNASRKRSQIEGITSKDDVPGTPTVAVVPGGAGSEQVDPVQARDDVEQDTEKGDPKIHVDLVVVRHGVDGEVEVGDLDELENFNEDSDDEEGVDWFQDAWDDSGIESADENDDFPDQVLQTNSTKLKRSCETVSYTHLTLPTKRIV